MKKIVAMMAGLVLVGCGASPTAPLSAVKPPCTLDRAFHADTGYVQGTKIILFIAFQCK